MALEAKAQQRRKRIWHLSLEELPTGCSLHQVNTLVRLSCLEQLDDALTGLFQQQGGKAYTSADQSGGPTYPAPGVQQAQGEPQLGAADCQ
jgi:hypothetical protein